MALPNISGVISKIIEISRDPHRPEENKRDAIRLITKQYATDILNLYINIQTTSAGEKDKQERIKLMCEQSGLENYAGKFY